MSALAFGHFKKTVTTAGTRVQLTATSTLARFFEIRGLAGNTGNIYVGDVTVASTNGYELDSGDVLSFSDMAGKNSVDEIDLSLIYIDSSVNGEGVTVFYAK